MTMVVFTVVFGSLAKLPSEGSAPYAVMVFAGLLPWTLSSSVLQEASAIDSGLNRTSRRNPEQRKRRRSGSNFEVSVLLSCVRAVRGGEIVRSRCTDLGYVAGSD